MDKLIPGSRDGGLSLNLFGGFDKVNSRSGIMTNKSWNTFVPRGFFYNFLMAIKGSRKFVMSLMAQRWVVFIMIFFIIAGTAYSKGLELQKRAGELDVEIKMDKNPPVLGDNRIEIAIRDGAGQKVTDAMILVNYYMPPMPRMAPMNYKTNASLKKEKYRATMNFIMTGPWNIAIKITRSQKTSSIKFSVDVQ